MAFNYKIVTIAWILLCPLTGIYTETKNNRPIVLNLQTAIKIGTTNNFALKALKERNILSRRLITEQWRKYLPSVGISYHRTESVQESDADSLSHEVRLNVEQVLMDDGTRALDYDSAKLDTLLGQSDFELAYRQNRINIIKSYLTTAQARGRLHLTRKSLKRAQNQLRLVYVEMDAGFATRIQVYTVAARVKEVELNFQNARSLYRRAVINLLAELKLESSTPLKISESFIYDYYLLSPKKLDSEILTTIALKSRPEIKRSRLSIEKARARKEKATSYWKPSISLGGYVGREGPEFPLSSRTWGAQLKFTFSLGSSTNRTTSGYNRSKDGHTLDRTVNSDFSLYDNMARPRLADEAKLSYLESLNEHQETERKIQVDILQNLEKVRQTWTQIRIGNVRAYTQYARIQMMISQYNAGTASRDNILEAELEYIQAQDDLLKALGDYILSVAAIENAIGYNPGQSKLFHLMPGRGNTLLPLLYEERFIDLRSPVDVDADANLIDRKIESYRIDETEREYLIDGINLD